MTYKSTKPEDKVGVVKMESATADKERCFVPAPWQRAPSAEGRAVMSENGFEAGCS